VVLIGYGPTALSALTSLARSFCVVRVLRNDSGNETDAVRSFALEAGIQISVLRDLNELAVLIADLRPDAIVISSFDRILPPSILALSCFINVHYSLLPRYRGRANVNWAIINGESAVGISIHLVAPGLDSGNLLFQESVAIGPNETVTSLYDRLNEIQECELGAAVARAIGGDIGSPQNSTAATYGCARVPDDGEIDWSRPTASIDRLVRALTKPFPGAFTHYDTRRLTIIRAEALSITRVYVGRVPGRVVGRSVKEGWVDVLTGDGMLRIFEIGTDPEPDLPRPAAEFILSTRATLGLSCLDLLRRIRALEQRVARTRSA
jgi:methionyl-tRNA formyltransferase